MPEEQEKLPKPLTDLPLPEKDLPLPEKELPAHTTESRQSSSTNEIDKPKGSFILKSFLLGILFVILVVLIGGGAFFLGQNTKSENNNKVICTDEALVCPDGTLTERKGPKCEFNPCPTPVVSPEDKGIISDSEKEGWKKYTNAKYGYSFEFPIDGKFTEDSGHVYYLEIGPTQEDGTDLYDALSFSVYHGSLNGQTIQELVEAQTAQSIKNQTGEIIEAPKPITIGGNTGITYRIQGLGEFTYIFVSPKNDLYIQIIDGSSDPTNKGFQRIVNQILSTFKFTDTVLPTDLPSNSPTLTLSPASN